MTPRCVGLVSDRIVDREGEHEVRVGLSGGLDTGSNRRAG